MKKFILVALMTSYVIIGRAQQSLLLDDVLLTMHRASAGKVDPHKVIDSIIKDPALYNTIWKEIVSRLGKSKGENWQFLPDLNIKFKTFTTDDLPSSSLGLSYNFDFDYSKHKRSGANVKAVSLAISAEGNIAFHREYNPNNFLDTKIKASFVLISGGTSTVTSTQLKDSMDVIAQKLTKTESDEGWRKLTEMIGMNNQYYLSISPKAAVESNQDFSKKQFSPGISLDLGAKAWSNRSTLAYFNLPDYPAALIRLITGTDKKFTLYGATIPTLQVAIDYIVPQVDVQRESLLGNLNPFPRFRLETSFRTLIANIGKEKIFLNANLRYYRELAAEPLIKNAGLASSTYFVSALQTSSGPFFSYAKGKLPFDAKTDAVYALGFNFKLR